MDKEYIKREAAKARLRTWIINCILDGDNEAADCFRDCIDLLDSIPAADVAPVVHGRWEYIPQTLNTLSQLRCPFCGWWSLDPSIDGAYNYCPNCGAKMDKEETNELDKR